MRRALALTAATAAVLLTGCGLDTAPAASGPACTTVTTRGMPANEDGVTVKAGKTTCDGSDTVLPLTITNGGDHLATVDLALKLSRGTGSERETILVEQELGGGKRLKETADIYPWGNLDAADGPIVATIGKLSVRQGPAPEPSEDADLPDGDVDRPGKCNRKWYC